MIRGLDLCCGLGGWSKGLAAVGIEPTGVDIVDVGYPYNFIQRDLLGDHGLDLTGYDVIVASPMCRDFSKMAGVAKINQWKDQPNPQRGLKLVLACLRVIEQARPMIWLLENVPGLIPYMDTPPVMTLYLTPTMERSFWGNFPFFMYPIDTTAKRKQDIGGQLRAWKRAEIPFPFAYAFANSVAEAIQRNTL